jgi:ABC-type molybdate transport system permease subunit
MIISDLLKMIAVLFGIYIFVSWQSTLIALIVMPFNYMQRVFQKAMKKALKKCAG